MPVLKLSTEEYQAAVFKALGHPTRLTIINMLAGEGEKCVCEIVDRLGFDQSTISKHLSVLRAVGIVASRKDGLNVIYSLSMPCVYRFMECIQNVISGSWSCLAKDAQCGTCFGVGQA
jgi:DNA-binding transcriptional ArsR family regulator